LQSEGIKEALLKGSVEEQLSQADQGIAEMERRKKELEAFSQQVGSSDRISCLLWLKPC